MRATTPGDAFLAAVAPILGVAGPLPHARLDTGGETTAPKKQATRMLKCECQACGYTVRTARKWLETAGAPLWADYTKVHFTYARREPLTNAGE